MCTSNGNEHVPPFDGMGIPSIQMEIGSLSLHGSWHPFSLNSSERPISRKWQGTPLPLKWQLTAPPIQVQQGPLPLKWQLSVTPSQYKHYMYFVLSILSIYNIFGILYIINYVQLQIAMGMPPTIFALAALPLKWHMVALLFKWQWAPPSLNGNGHTSS